MIRLSRPQKGQAIFDLASSVTAAYVDRDWIPDGEGPVHAPYVTEDGGIWYRRQRLSAQGPDPMRCIAGLISAMVDEIVGLVDGVAAGRLGVTGRGMTAAEVRRRLGIRAISSAVSPAAIIEMTGKAAELRRATESVADGGLIVLAGESDPPTEINLYQDVHRRGIQVLGAPRLGATREPSEVDGLSLPDPVSVRAAEPLPTGQWYRVVR